jgi:lipopolysaccharide cholinephosphotransferase
MGTMLTDKQKHLYMLFKEVDALCRSHNIQYQLAGGTLIGAVRHRGFIPWDDDMDITMTRNNWEKFIEVCKTELPKGRVLECQELNHDFHNVIARYTDSTSSAVHSTQVIAKDTAGDMIDIICYDYLPDNNKSWKKYTKDIVLYSDLINPTIVYSYRFRANQFRYGFYRLKMRIQGRDKVLTDLEKRMFTYKEEDCPYVVLRWGGTPLIFRKEIFGNSSNDVQFEDTVAQAPDFISDYIVEHYEDEWMFIPPATEQGGHNSIYSLDTDYRVIRNEINHFIDPEKERKKFLRKKAFAMQIMAPWMILKNLNILLTEKSKSKIFKADFQKKTAEIQSAYDNNDFGRLEEIFSDFYALQFSKEFFGRDDYDNVYKYRHPVILKIQPDMADKAVYTLFNRNSISKALRMINVYQQKHKSTPFMDSLKNEIMLFRNAVHIVSVGDEEKALTGVQELYSRHPYSIGILKLYIIILKRINIEENREKITELLNFALTLYPEDGELLKYALDLRYREQGSVLVTDYMDAYDKTLNGLVRLEIQDILLENMNVFNNEEMAYRALSILPDNKTLVEKYIDFVLNSGSQEKIYSLFSFLRTKEQVLNKDYGKYHKAVSSFFIADNKACEYFENISKCESYEQLTSYEEQLEKEENSSVISFLTGELLYKKGLTTKAVKAYINAVDGCNEGIKFLLKKRFIFNLKSLKSAFDYADGITTIDTEQKVEIPASDKQKSMVKEKLFAKWTEPYGSAQVLLQVLNSVGIITTENYDSLTVSNMEELINRLNLQCNREITDSFENLDPLKHKVDIPDHYDHNLTEAGDFNE